MEDRYIDSKELAQYMGIGYNQALAIMKRPDFPSISHGSRKRLVRISKLNEFMDNRDDTGAY